MNYFDIMLMLDNVFYYIFFYKPNKEVTCKIMFVYLRLGQVVTV